MTPALSLGLDSAPGGAFRIQSDAVDHALTKARAAHEARGGGRLLSVHVDVPPFRATDWELVTTPAGRVSWRSAIVSEGASFLRPHFSRLPSESQVFVYGPGAEQGLPVRPTGSATSPAFWGPVVFGEVLIIEVLGDGKAPPELFLDKVSRGVASLLPVVSEQWCYLDPSCYPEWAETMTGAAEIYIEWHWGGGSCSGSLLDDTAHTRQPWFLTANHCLNTQWEADTVIIYWNFHTYWCNGQLLEHEFLPTSSGAQLMAGNSGSDFSLLLLDEAPPQSVTYLDWSTEPLGPGDEIIVLHHPDETYKRITFGNLVGSDGDFWEVRYTESSTEGGSSGSPLFNASHQVIGQLYGGGAACDRMWATDTFGKLGVSWDRGLSDYLDAEPPTTTTTTTGTTTTTIPADDDLDDDVDDDLNDDLNDDVDDDLDDDLNDDADDDINDPSTSSEQDDDSGACSCI